MTASGRQVNRFISIILSIFLILPVQFIPVGALLAAPLTVPLQYQVKPQTQFRQLVIYVPDIFDSARQVEKALDQLRAKGIPKKDIINLAQHAGFDVQQGLKTQAKQLAGIVDMESAKRQGLKAYLVAKGTGGLVVRSYLATAKKLRSVGAPIENVVAVGVPHQGRQWAKLAYSIALPLPVVGSRSLAVRDLAPDSPFMRELNQHKDKRKHLLEGAQAVLKKIDDFTFKKELKTKLAAIDRAKIEVRDEVERILYFPERLQLSDREKYRIREMKTIGREINKIITVGADPPVLSGAEGRVGSFTGAHQKQLSQVKKTAKKIKKQQHKIDQRIQQQTQGKTAPLAKKMAKINDLSKTVSASASQVQKQLQQKLESSQLYKIKVAFSAGLTDPKTNMQKHLAKISLAVSNQVKDLEINKQLDVIAEYAKQVQLDLEKEWQGFTQKAVTEQSEVKRTQEKFVSAISLQAAWDAMEQKRKEWLDTVKQYADNKAQARLEIQLESYQLQLQDQVKQMDVKVRDKQAELLRKLDSVTEKLSAQADILFANNQVGDVKQKVKEQFGEYKKAKQIFLSQAEKTKREVSDKIFRNEYFVYLKQADRMDQVLMEAVDKKTRHLQYALLGLEKGQARKEMEMFARSSRKRLSRETEKLKKQIVGAGFTLARQTTAGAGFVDPKNVGAGFTPALKDWQVLQDVRYLHKQAVALKTTLPQQSKALQKSLAACEVIQHLEKYGDIEQQLKMHTGGFTRPYTGDLYQLSSQRRQLVQHIQNLADQGAQQIKKADIAQFAARLNAFGEKINRRGGVSPPTNRRGRVYPCPDFRLNPETFQQSGEKFRQIAQDQAEYFIDAQKTLNMHRKLTEIQSVQQQATDMLQQKIQKTTQLAQLREYVSQVKAVENTLARVQESETQLVQMDLQETRLLGLQKKTKEYHDNLRVLGKKLFALPEPVQKEWKHLEAKAQAAGKDFITPEWKTLKKDL